MATKHDIADAIRANDARIEGLRTRILVRPEQPLPEGEWHVRDALSHVAARANPVPRILARVKALDGADAGPAPRIDIDEINHGQVEERHGASPEELLAEIAAGHAAAIEELAGLDDELLSRVIPLGFRPGDTTVGDMLNMAGAGHERTHLNDVATALEG